MNSSLHISSSPHIHSGRTTQKIMLDVILSLLPAVVAGVIIFGLRALLVVAVCVAGTVASEAIFALILKKKQTIGDLSAAVTGLILALNLPATVPLWEALVGCVFAIIIVKCIFGGLGKNLVNPAVAARVFMLISFSSMAASAPPVIVDSISGATPLASIAEGNMPTLQTLLLGTYGGAIGETCSLALLIGGSYLLARRVIKWQIPVAFCGGVFVLSFLFNGFDAMSAFALTLSGGLLIGAIFMATDYVTSPSTGAGQLIFGFGAALITVLIRFWGNYPEGVSFAILLMNIITPYIDAWTPRKLFGGGKHA